MLKIPETLLFDKGDYELLEFLDRMLEVNNSTKSLKRLFDPYLHPHGIKELAATREIRIAYAMIRLLGSLKEGKVQSRLNAMRSLHSEIMSEKKTTFRLNTARVLLQIMKEIIRSDGEKRRKLELIHDFRTALAARPRTIRKELKKYHLLEMSEEWNQLSFDDHIHDANTKGRKTSSHLIMDAWIKGIKSLKIIYYNHIRPEAARELLDAAEIMGVNVRISVEFPVKFNDSYVQLIWAPRGFSNSRDFMNFLHRDSVKKFMNAGIELSKYQSSYTMAVLDHFNREHLQAINEKFNTSILSITQDELNAFVGTGQLSRVHLAELIHIKLSETLEENNLPTPGEIYDDFLQGSSHPKIVYPGGFKGGEELPDLLKLSTPKLIEHFSTISTSYRLTLNLTDLNEEDVINLLFETNGKITHLEIFNLKDYSQNPNIDNSKIEDLREIINDQNVICLKQFIIKIIENLENSEEADAKSRIKKLTTYLDRLPELLEYYNKSPLRLQIGSDSTGRAWRFFGMGFAALDSLTPQARREIKSKLGSKRTLIPFQLSVFPRKTYIPRNGNGTWLDDFYNRLKQLPIINYFAYSHQLEWIEEDNPTRKGRSSEIVSLGGGCNDAIPTLDKNERSRKTFAYNWKYMNTNVKNVLKVLIGFIPAFLTFYLTKNDWWVLQYGGAVIWFGITGFRNVIQSVLGGRGLKRSKVLPWNNFVSWGRVADSLLFTGFSVPLLDYLVKTLCLQRGLGITTTTNPIMLYTLMGIANGFYISTHNIFRGLPKGAIVGNFFRSIISIPVAILFNILIGGVLGTYGVMEVNMILQKWAAVISKTASDCVAGVIEGYADRFSNIRIRIADYKIKMKQIIETFTQLELLFPRKNVTQMLEKPEDFLKTVTENSEKINNLDASIGRSKKQACLPLTPLVGLKDIMIVNALDMLYIWMYQPRARNAFNIIFSNMSPEEQQIIIYSHNVLKCEKEISTLFVDGLVGKKFASPLAFYLERHKKLLEMLKSTNK